jgi:peptidoglycan/xylan/chitin deacetylase (PgdA/CDA1 family)
MTPWTRARLGLSRRAHRAVARAVGLRWALEGDRPVVALTFDDGPDPAFTPQVLDVLAERAVTATFFCTGAHALAHPGIVRRIEREGHGLGSHTRTHPFPQGLDRAALTAEYRGGRTDVEAVAGRSVTAFRAPQGLGSMASMAAMAAAGVRGWAWSLDTEDWRPRTTAEEIVAAVREAGPGDVVLLHDAIARTEWPETADRSATVAALPGVLDVLAARGLTPVALPGSRP